MIKTIKNYCCCLFGRLNLLGNLAVENVALRQQIIVLKRNQKRPVLKERDRLFWVILSRIWRGWRDAVYIVRPDTVVRWQKKAFKAYWRCRSEKGKRGRPPLDLGIRALILKVANANPLWSAPKIHGELLKLGILVS